MNFQIVSFYLPAGVDTPWDSLRLTKTQWDSFRPFRNLPSCRGLWRWNMTQGNHSACFTRLKFDASTSRFSQFSNTSFIAFSSSDVHLPQSCRTSYICCPDRWQLFVWSFLMLLFIFLLSTSPAYEPLDLASDHLVQRKAI